MKTLHAVAALASVFAASSVKLSDDEEPAAARAAGTWRAELQLRLQNRVRSTGDSILWFILIVVAVIVVGLLFHNHMDADATKDQIRGGVHRGAQFVADRTAADTASSLDPSMQTKPAAGAPQGGGAAPVPS